MEKDPVIKKKLIGLYPLLPLMERNNNETDDGLMEETITTIKTVENEALQADLLAVTSILAGERFSNELVKKYIRRDMLMSSPLFNEWVEEERKEAAEKATEKATKEAQIETTKKNILSWLSEKFDFVPKNIIESVLAIDDIAVLDWLHKKIIKVETIENFNHLIEEAMSKK